MPGGIEHFETHWLMRYRLQVVVQDGPTSPQEPVGRSRGEQIGIAALNLGCHLLERRDVVQNPKAAPVGRYHQIVEPLLDLDPRNRCVWQSGLQRPPAFPVVGGVVKAVLSACKQQSAS